MAAPITLEMIQNVIKQYESLIKKYPQAKDLPDSLKFWKEKEEEYKKKQK
jgi:hypothetical protein